MGVGEEKKSFDARFFLSLSHLSYFVFSVCTFHFHLVSSCCHLLPMLLLPRRISTKLLDLMLLLLVLSLVSMCRFRVQFEEI